MVKQLVNLILSLFLPMNNFSAYITLHLHIYLCIHYSLLLNLVFTFQNKLIKQLELWGKTEMSTHSQIESNIKKCVSWRSCYFWRSWPFPKNHTFVTVLYQFYGKHLFLQNSNKAVSAAMISGTSPQNLCNLWHRYNYWDTSRIKHRREHEIFYNMVLFFSYQQTKSVTSV